MAFKALYLSHAPDADYTKHRSFINTGKYKLWSVVVKNQEEAIKVAKKLYEEEKINAIILCPGFTHTDVAEFFQELEGKVAINASRGDGPSSKIAQEALQKEFFN